MSKILIVDDDSHILEVVRFALEKAGYETCCAKDGQEALQRFQAEHPDLIVLDILMPELDGTSVCREIRRRADTPIIFLTSKNEEIDRIVGLELGADDYVVKPFSPRELVARVNAVMRRTDNQVRTDDKNTVITCGRLRLDRNQHRVFWEDNEVDLTATEFGILRTLIMRPGKVFTRDELMSGAYELHKVVSDRTIDSHVRRLRAKLLAVNADSLRTIHGVGYKLIER
jgi:two-component system, OmpR family, response regulator